MSELLVPLQELRSFSTTILERAGMRPHDAACVADSLVTANQRGVDSHGIVRLIAYVRKIESGGTKAQPAIRVVRDGKATAVVDGDNGMGQVVGVFSMKQAIERARRYGVGMVVANNSEHFGAAAYYAQMAVKHGMIGFATTNAPPVMAPWGGKAQAIGNNPVAFAVPSKELPELVVDASMSRVAGGKVRLAGKKGESIPEGWILNAEGKPSTDPNDLPKGALLAEGHKGYSLAVIMEVLSGALSGAAMLSAIPNWLFEPTKATNTGHAFIAIDVSQFVPLEEFLTSVEKMRTELRDVPPASGVDQVLIPGDLEAQVQRTRLTSLPIPHEVAKDLAQLGERFGVATDPLGF